MFDESVQAALRAADSYMDAFNAHDQEGMADACNFPHVRIAGGSVRIWQTRNESMIPGLFDWLKEAEGWHHSRWNHQNVVHAGPDKVHLDVSFSRCDADDTVLGVYPSIWVMTSDEGHWGIQARSSYAG
jgi:hypothetical protein